MAKITLKGIVQRITHIENVGANGETRKQSVILDVPAYVDEFGEKRGKDQIWKLDLINDKIESFNLNTSLHGKKVIADVYVSSQLVKNRDGEDIYIVNANLGKLELFDPNNRPTPASTGNKW